MGYIDNFSEKDRIITPTKTSNEYLDIIDKIMIIITSSVRFGKRERQIYKMKNYYNLSHNQIADILGISVYTSKTIIRDCNKKINEIIEEINKDKEELTIKDDEDEIDYTIRLISNAMLNYKENKPL